MSSVKLMKQIITTIFLLTTLFMSGLTSAAPPLTCQQFAGTKWQDSSDPQFQVLSLTLRGADINGDNGTINTLLEFYGGSFSFDSYQAICTKQADGSIQLVLAYQDYNDEGYLTLQSVDGKTFNVLPNSYLTTNRGQHSFLRGPFSRL